RAQDDLSAGVPGIALVPRNNRSVFNLTSNVAPEIIRAIKVEERRSCQLPTGVERARPGEIEENVSFPIDIPNAGNLSLRVIGDLVVICAGARHDPQLIGRSRVIDQRGKATQAAHLVVKHFRGRSRQPEVTPVAVYACIISETLAVTAKSQLVVSLVEITIADD